MSLVIVLVPYVHDAAEGVVEYKPDVVLEEEELLVEDEEDPEVPDDRVVLEEE